MTALNGDRWLFEKLTTDSQLATLLGGRVFVDVAPQDTEYPFAVIAAVSSVPVNNWSADRIMDNELWQVALWDDGASYLALESIADRVRAMVHKAASTGSATGVIGAVYEGAGRRSEEEGDRVFKVIILEFRLYTQ